VSLKRWEWHRTQLRVLPAARIGGNVKLIGAMGRDDTQPGKFSFLQIILRFIWFN
jgi:hypothetical protein